MEKHIIELENRKAITVTEVRDIEAFDEDVILVNLDDDGIIIKGENLNIEKLDLTEGILTATGTITSLTYTGRKHRYKEKKGLSGMLKGRRETPAR